MRNPLTVNFVMALALTGILVACGGEDPLQTRDAGQMSADELAAAVAASMPGLRPYDPDNDEDGLRLYPRGRLLLLQGTVDSDSYDQVYDALKDAPDIEAVVLVVVPGSADDEVNLKLGRMLRQARMTTYLPATGLVASGGVDLLISGARRIMERGAAVGVHSWAASDGTNGDDLPRDHADHRIFLDYYEEMGIPEEFYWFTLRAAPPEDLHWMTEAELQQYRVYTVLR